MKKNLIVVGMLSVVMGGFAAYATRVNSAVAATELLPNLTPKPAYDLRISTSRNKSYLHLSTTSWNKGSGPLEIVGADADETVNKQKVFQRIYDDTGAYREVFAGWFTYHRRHKHVHFDDYAIYTIESVSDPTVKAVGSKQTFCLMDTDLVDSSLAGSPTTRIYNTCNSHIQGMSVGWGDTYDHRTSGQSVDISKLPDGDYDLKITVDPNNVLVESDESDNQSSVRVNISGTTVTVL